MKQQEISLVAPTARLAAAFLAMAQEFLAAGDARYESEIRDFPGYLARLSNQTRAETLPPDRVPGNEFWLVADQRVLGRSKLRHWLTPALEHEGGHIGYDIRPAARRQGYGTLLLKLTLLKAAAVGLQRVRLTCDADNLGSARSIGHNGGVLSGRAVSERSGQSILQYRIEL